MRKRAGCPGPEPMPSQTAQRPVGVSCRSGPAASVWRSKATGGGHLTDDTRPRGEPAIQIERHVELVDAVDAPAGRVDREMKRPAFGPREENRLIEWRGSRKHPNDRPGRGVDD